MADTRSTFRVGVAEGTPGLARPGATAGDIVEQHDIKIRD